MSPQNVHLVPKAFPSCPQKTSTLSPKNVRCPQKSTLCPKNIHPVPKKHQHCPQNCVVPKEVCLVLKNSLPCPQKTSISSPRNVYIVPQKICIVPKKPALSSKNVHLVSKNSPLCPPKHPFCPQKHLPHHQKTITIQIQRGHGPSCGTRCWAGHAVRPHRGCGGGSPPDPGPAAPGSAASPEPRPQKLPGAGERGRTRTAPRKFAAVDLQGLADEFTERLAIPFTMGGLEGGRQAAEWSCSGEEKGEAELVPARAWGSTNTAASEGRESCPGDGTET